MESFKHILAQTAEREAGKQYRFLIVNEHYLGHVTVHRLFCRALAQDPAVDFEPGRDTVELDTAQNWLEKVRRRLASLRFGTAWMQQQGLDLGRWRFQRFVALLARKRVLQKLAQAKKEGRPYDAIAFHSQTAALACLDIMQAYPCLVSTDITNAQAAREWNIPATRWTYWPSIRLERAVFQAAGGVATFSEWARQAVLSENPRLPEDNVRHYPPGVELEAFLSIPLQRPGRDKLQLLFVGGDFKRKGGFDLVACFRQALQETCQLHIVSNGAPEELAGDGVFIHKNLQAYSPELLQRYAAADVFVLPTHNEAYGHVFIEAMAAGLPVVATAINAIPEIVPETGHALLVPVGDLSALQSAISKLQANPDVRTALGEAGRQRAIEHFDAQQCFARYVEWLKALSQA